MNHRILELPWVKLLKGDPPRCEGIKWGQVSLKHLYSMGGRPPEGIPDRAHCKNRARYRFTSLTTSSAKSGNYCWVHLTQQITDCDHEVVRATRWLARHQRVTT